MSKQSSVVATQSKSAGVTRSTGSVLERRRTLGPHVNVQRDATGPATHPAAPSLVRDVLESPGRPLDTATRSLMEPRLGYDFSQVRVHADERSAESARAVSARAYTAGTDVVFGTGHYSPGTSQGQHLLAHELKHVVQQSQKQVSGNPVGDGLSVSHPSDVFEREAREAANSAVTDDHTGPSSQGFVAALPEKRSTLSETRIQRADTDLSSGLSHNVAAAGIVGGYGGGLSAIFSGIGLIAAFDSAKQAKRQAEAGEKQAVEAEKQTGIQEESLEVAKQALEVSENPPAPPPTTGGIVVNNNGGYADIPSVPAPKGSAAPKVETDDKPFTILKISQGPKNYATFNAVVKGDGREIKGGYLQDGDAQGYIGGSAASNLNLTLKPMAGPPVPSLTPKGKPTTVASVKFLISGNNIAPRTKSGTDIQHFSGAVTLSAAGDATPSKPFNVTGGTKTVGSTSAEPALTLDLPTSVSTPGDAKKKVEKK
jgi:Domain of unknown function (DUF4157)